MATPENFSIREQIVALIQGDLDSGEAVTLMKQLIHSPDESQFFVDQIALSRKLQKTFDAVASDPATDKEIWHQIERFESMHVHTAAEEVSAAVGVVRLMRRLPWLRIGIALGLVLLGGILARLGDKYVGKAESGAVTAIHIPPAPSTSTAKSSPQLHGASHLDHFHNDSIAELRARLADVESDLHQLRFRQQQNPAVSNA